MDNQVRFYSISAAASPSDVDGIYFRDGGHIYKGTSKFGATTVFVVSNADDLDPNAEITSGKIEGDVAVGYGSARIWNGNQWIPLENINQQKTLVSLMTAGLSVGNSESYITSITQDGNGNVSASAKPFPTLNLSASTVGGSGNGIEVSVTTQSGAVTSVQVSASSLKVDDIEANSATFSNIFVNNVAMLSTTYVDASVVEADSAIFESISANSLTIGGSTVSEITQAQIAEAMVSEIRSLSLAESSKIASEHAIRNAIDAASMIWVDASGQPIP